MSPSSSSNARRSARNRRVSPIAVLGAIVLGALLGLALLWVVVRQVQHHYANRIYPHVYVLGVDLGGLTVPEAEAVLSTIPPGDKPGGLLLDDGQSTRYATWSELGARLDIEATAVAAYQIGHDLNGTDLRDFVRTWLDYHAVTPLYGLDIGLARNALERLSTSLDRAPSDPRVSLSDGVLSLEPGTPGRALDVEASLVVLLSAAQRGDEAKSLVFSEIPARQIDLAPLQAELEDLLGPRIELVCYDLVADHTYRWTLDEQSIVHWIRLEPGGTADTWALGIDTSAVRTTLSQMSAEMGEGRGFDLDEVTSEVLATYRAGGGTVNPQMTYAPRSYTVQSGDTAVSIAAAFGMALWPLAQANPDLNLDSLRPGQEIVIPSQNVLTPYPPVASKRIVVSLTDHIVTLYEHGTILHQWPVATGREDSPTALGTFQVLDKEENAYASLWDLQMPHFVALYVAGPGFYNGIHALPILSNGQRLWSGALGTSASYGCIILGVDEAKTLYDWAEIGTPVVIEP